MKKISSSYRNALLAQYETLLSDPIGEFKKLFDLAGLMGGEVGGTRPVVYAGWLETEALVGQAGKHIKPKILLSFGISGAIQHLVGMQDSDVIIAINRDRQAPIFEVSTYGIEGDLFEVVPAVTNRIRELRAQKRR